MKSHLSLRGAERNESHLSSTDDMYLLDTNVLSELMSTRGPDERVAAWVGQADAEALYTSSITRAEIAFGVTLLPDGRRRDQLTALSSEIFELDFAGRVLPFDSEAATIYGTILAHRRELGRPMGELDGQIASIAKLRGLAIVTRNTRDFESCDVALFDPWQHQQH